MLLLRLLLVYAAASTCVIIVVLRANISRSLRKRLLILLLLLLQVIGLIASHLNIDLVLDGKIGLHPRIITIIVVSSHLVSLNSLCTHGLLQNLLLLTISIVVIELGLLLVLNDPHMIRVPMISVIT